MNFNFSPPSIKQWQEYLARASKVSWMQTIPFATASYQFSHRLTKFVTIEKNGETIGAMALQEIKLGFVHFINIYRGPLFFKGHETEENFKDFTQLLKKTYPKRLFRRFRWMPEWHIDEKSGINFIEEAGFQKAQQSFETLWMDITPSLDQIRANLKQKWRNSLNKAIRSPLKTSADIRGEFLEIFLLQYALYKAEKKFRGPSAKFFKKELQVALHYKDALILWAHINDIPVAGIVVFKHGKTASYRLGWNSIQGREHNAHYLLLWKAIEWLKTHNIEALDLGGILPDDSDGLTKFKLGLGGSHFRTEVLK